MFYYICMSFSLKNVGSTYQRVMRITLSPQLGQNVEAYVDDLVAKTRNHATLLENLADMFSNLRMKINPSKSVFGVPSGKLLCFLVSSQGIEANPER